MSNTSTKTAQYIIGIDLGTTNCVLASTPSFVPEDEKGEISLFSVPQLINANEVAEQKLLPSFLYLPNEYDFPKGSISLPWNTEQNQVVGELARKRGAENPSRFVASAKSWLCNQGVNRTQAILPWQAPVEVSKVSPLEASCTYLEYLRRSWDYKESQSGSGAHLSEQEIFLTVPASFDMAARDLTMKAAELAGLHNVTLLEEPQAAFYSWIENQGERWRKQVKVGDLILVCDVGGGTTDFSLIAVSEEQGELTLNRVAVGEHILLGGDNMDLALARLLQFRLQEKGTRIDNWQLQSLWYRCRVAKERLLSSPDLESEPVTILGKGTGLVAGTITTELKRSDIEQILLEGFFPICSYTDMPAKQRRVALQEIGLSYAADPCVTKHLAKFLSQQARSDSQEYQLRRSEDGLACPTAILFNGGVMKADILRHRVIGTLNKWLESAGFEPIKELFSQDLDTAVACGAAYYGQARHGRGVRIRGGASRTYYIGIESSMPAIPGFAAPLKALCVVPFGMEEGTRAKIHSQEFGLVVGEPAEFRFLSSTTRKKDSLGTLVEDWSDDIQEQSPLEVTLSLPGQEDSVLPVELESHMTEIGTLELWCVARDNEHRWKLEFNVREREEE
ncbi:MAG: Hsp70 family protein [Acidobacteria bacterium]|nr:Hsp70 family protein [Acidobacteriota bacterium]